jgi:hypothetical protein
MDEKLALSIQYRPHTIGRHPCDYSFNSKWQTEHLLWSSAHFGRRVWTWGFTRPAGEA